MLRDEETLMPHLSHDELTQPVFVVLPGSSRFLLTRQHLSDVTGVRSCHSKGATRIPGRVAAQSLYTLVSETRV